MLVLASAGSKGATNLLNWTIWLWLKIKGLRRFWSMFPLTRDPFWYRFFEPQPFELATKLFSSVRIPCLNQVPLDPLARSQWGRACAFEGAGRAWDSQKLKHLFDVHDLFFPPSGIINPTQPPHPQKERPRGLREKHT